MLILAHCPILYSCGYILYDQSHYLDVWSLALQAELLERDKGCGHHLPTYVKLGPGVLSSYTDHLHQVTQLNILDQSSVTTGLTQCQC